MDTISLVITLLLGALMLWLAVWLPLAIRGNLRRGHGFREALAERLGELRLSRMLANLGIDRAAYLHQAQAVEIKRHMARCEACDSKTACDQALAGENSKPIEELGFCANIEDLDRIRPLPAISEPLAR
jgi:hypothetical protein